MVTKERLALVESVRGLGLGLGLGLGRLLYKKSLHAPKHIRCAKDRYVSIAGRFLVDSHNSSLLHLQERFQVPTFIIAHVDFVIRHALT